MTRWMIVAGLVVLNAILGAGVYQLLERKAQAGGVGPGPRPEIAVVTGMSGGQAVIYMLEPAGLRLVAQRVDVTNAKLEVIGRRDVAQDMARVP